MRNKLILITAIFMLFSIVYMFSSCSNNVSDDTTQLPITDNLSTSAAVTSSYATAVKTLDTTVPATSDKTPDTTKTLIITTATFTTETPTTAAPPEIGTHINVVYKSNNLTAGEVNGKTDQIVLYGKSKTSKVEAIAKLGYKFTGWSDGVSDPIRSNESPQASCVIIAMFELDTLEMPILMINTETGRDVESKTEYINGTIGVYNAPDRYLFENYKMQIRGRGNYTWSIGRSPMEDKRPYRIKLSEGMNLLGIGNGKAKDWVLIANHCDQALLRNYISYDFNKSLSGIAWQPAVLNVEVYLNGEYHGVYLLTEQVEVDDDRIDISEDVSNEQLDLLVHMSGYSQHPYFTVNGCAQPFEVKSDLSTDRTLAKKQISYMQSQIETAWNAVVSGDKTEIEKVIDISSILDIYMSHETFKHLDTGWDNFYMYKKVGGKLVFGPIWDFDQSGGNADVGCEDYRYLRAAVENCWFRELMQNDWFKKMVIDRWNSLMPRLELIPVIIRAMGKEYNGSFNRNFEKWQIFGMKINRETASVRALRSYDEHNEYYAVWMENRIDWLNDYFNSEEFYYDGTISFEGTGDKDSPYLIQNAKDYKSFITLMRMNRNFSNVYFNQTADIDLTGENNFQGIGGGYIFDGYYNGCGHRIIANISSGDGALFPYVTGTIINLITAGSINNSAQAGGICRSLRVGGKIINCGSFMSVTSSGRSAGGFSASNQAGGTSYIINCWFLGNINAAKTGAFISDCNGGVDGFDNCYYIDSINDQTGVCTKISKSDISKLYATLNVNITNAAELAKISTNEFYVWSASDLIN